MLIHCIFILWVNTQNFASVKTMGRLLVEKNNAIYVDEILR